VRVSATHFTLTKDWRWVSLCAPGRESIVSCAQHEVDMTREKGHRESKGSAAQRCMAVSDVQGCAYHLKSRPLHEICS
jgi:hypothetical protein